MRLPIVHHPGYDAEFPASHRFPMSKYRALADLLGERGMLDARFLVPGPADAPLLCGAHDAAYVDQVIACRVPRPIEREIGFEVNEKVSRRARLAAAGTLRAAELALAEGIACNAAGGSHHARRLQGAGFCTFNDVAVAAAALLDRHAVERILVVDCDVHQGDGTADILAGRRDVFTFSLHGERNYPTRKIASHLDIGLPDGTEDDAYLEALGHGLAEIDQHFSPDLVFYNAGIDPHREDRLGRLSLSDEGLAERDRRVIARYRERSIAVCGVIGGGYSNDVDRLARRHAMLFEVAECFA
jgi:acetoin utilization deacetylase AcuC-like enzyme